MKNSEISLLRADLKALEDRIRTVKQALRRPWTGPMEQVQAEALELAAEATELCTLRAWARGRLHRTVPPRDLRDSCEALGIPLRWDPQEHNRKVAERVAKRYRTPPSRPVAAVASLTT